jgi:hypothetical protein
MRQGGLCTQDSSWKFGTWVLFWPVEVKVEPTQAITGSKLGFWGDCCAIMAATSQKPIQDPVDA